MEPTYEQLESLINESGIEETDAKELLSYGHDAAEEILSAYLAAKEFNSERTLYPGEFLQVLKKTGVIGRSRGKKTYDRAALEANMKGWEMQGKVLDIETCPSTLDPGFHYSSIRRPGEDTERAVQYLEKIASEFPYKGIENIEYIYIEM